MVYSTSSLLSWSGKYSIWEVDVIISLADVISPAIGHRTGTDMMESWLEVRSGRFASNRVQQTGQSLIT